MRYGVSVPNFGSFADPIRLVRLAVVAEEAGWDGFFVWDHMAVDDGLETLDPWTILGVVAATTDRISLGPMVTPLPRRRPWVVARQATTVDHLSGGRLTLGVGIGNPPDEEFGRFGEPTDDRVRADMLDEALHVIQRMWSGEAFTHRGEHYTVRESSFAPTPVRPQGIPIWVAATWPNRRPLLRATRYQGAFPFKADMSSWTTDDLGELVSFLSVRRGDLDGFDVVISGPFDQARSRSEEFGRAGVTWMLSTPGMGDSIDDVEVQLANGPPPDPAR